VTFGVLLGAGRTGAEAAICLAVRPEAAQVNTLAPGLAELAAILGNGQDRGGLGGQAPKGLAGQRTVTVLLTQTPSAVRLVCQSAGYLQQRAAELQRAGFAAAEVAALAWWQPVLLCTDSAARIASRAAVLQQELGLPMAQVVSLVAQRKPSWVNSSVDTLRERAAALAEVSGAECW